jgi:hypothetical protein
VLLFAGTFKLAARVEPRLERWEQGVHS